MPTRPAPVQDDVPTGLRRERFGRVSFALPDAMVRRHVELRAFRCELWDEPWPPLPDEPPDARRAARQRARDEAWARWFVGLQAKAVDQDPEGFNPSDLGFYEPRDLPQMLAERQLDQADGGAPVESPPPGARWLRAATYLRDGSRDPAYSDGRALLDAGPVRLWLSTFMGYNDGDPELEDLLFGNLAAAAAAYRPGPTPPPGPAFVLHHGALVGEPISWAETTVARYKAPLPWQGRGVFRGAPFDSLAVEVHTNQFEPEGYAWTLDEGLTASNAMARREGITFSKVLEETREAGGLIGLETASSARKQGDHPSLDLIYEWQVEGEHRDPFRPHISVKAEVELDPSLSGAAFEAVEAERRAVWDRVVDSLVTPASDG